MWMEKSQQTTNAEATTTHVIAITIANAQRYHEGSQIISESRDRR
jgi:hypothetical protein